MDFRRPGDKRNTLALPGTHQRVSKRSSTQPCQINFYQFKETAGQIIEESSNVCTTLRSLRSEIKKSESQSDNEQNCRSFSKDLEMANVLKDLQREMAELNKIITCTHEKIKGKELENHLLQEGILQIKEIYAKDQGVNCACIIN